MANPIYTLRYAHNDSDTPGTMRMLAVNDRLAITEARQFVLNGYRNQTWARVALSDGRVCHCRNEHGQVMTHIFKREAA